MNSHLLQGVCHDTTGAVDESGETPELSRNGKARSNPKYVNPLRTIGWLTVMLLLIFSLNALAQEIPVYKTPPVLVTPANFREPEPDSIVELPPHSTSKAATLDDVLRGAPGVVVTRSGGPGQPSTLFIRGASSAHTLVLLDGVEINDPSQPAGGFDFSTIDLNLVEKVEIFKGPQALRYGSGAMGGVVNIRTKKGGLGKNILAARAGSHNTNQATASRLGQSYALSVTRYETTGISAAAGEPEADGHRYLAGAFHGGYQWSEDTELEFISRALGSTSDLDFAASTTAPFGQDADDPNYTAENFHLINALKGSTNWNSKWKSNFTLSHFHMHRTVDNRPDERNSSVFHDDRQATSTKMDNINSYALNSKTTLAFGPTVRLEKAQNSAWIAGAFADANLSLRPFFLQAGGRYDYHQQFGGEFTYAISPGVRLFDDTTLFARLATAFKAPSLFQIYDATYGNPDLRPESVRGEELGAEQGFGEDIRTKLTVFRYRYRDLIQFGPPYRNIATADTTGLEFEYSHKLHKIDLQGAYTYTDARDSTGARLVRQPFSSWRAGTGAAITDSINARAEYRGVGSRPDFHALSNAPVTTAAYDVLDISVALSLGSSTQITASVENAVDKQYQEIAGYGAPGLGVYLGAKTEL